MLFVTISKVKNRLTWFTIKRERNKEGKKKKTSETHRNLNDFTSTARKISKR